MNLYDLTAAYQTVQESIENGEDLTGILETLDDAIEAKADGYAKVMKNMQSQIEGFKAEEKRMAEQRKRLEAGVEWLKGNLFDAMKKTGKTKFKTALFSFSIQKNAGKLPIILDVKDTSELPDELVIVTEKPDLEAIRKLIESGNKKYAHFDERGESLRIK